MSKNYILIILMLLLSVSTIATQNITLDSNIYPQNINTFMGVKDDNIMFEEPIKNLGDIIIRTSNQDNEIRIESLVDNTDIDYISLEDIYTNLQKMNANANVSLYTQKDINQEIRDKTNIYTIENINWIYFLIIMIMQLFSILFNIAIILISIYLFFRLIPLIFKWIKNLMFKIIVKVDK